MVVVIGVDAHKKTHTLVALDGNGRKLAEKTVEATDAGPHQSAALGTAEVRRRRHDVGH